MLSYHTLGIVIWVLVSCGNQNKADISNQLATEELFMKWPKVHKIESKATEVFPFLGKAYQSTGRGRQIGILLGSWEEKDEKHYAFHPRV